MAHVAELDDWDRKPLPMSKMQRIPSPYMNNAVKSVAEPPRVAKERAFGWAGAVAATLFMASCVTLAVGAATIVRWAWRLL